MWRVRMELGRGRERGAYADEGAEAV